MPRLKAEIITTVETAVELSPKLQKQLKVKLQALREKTRAKKALEGEITTAKTELETLFADSGEYDALVTGVSVMTPFGEVPLKIITGKTGPKLNEKKLMVKFKLSPKDLDSCRDPGKDKASYLGVFLPKEDEDEDGDN